MGQDIDTGCFSSNDYQLFGDRLEESLDILKQILAKPGFGEGDLTLGAELESYITDENGQVLNINNDIFCDLNHSQLQLELNKFNIEFNLTPVPLAGTPFSKIESEIDFSNELLNTSAKKFGGRVVPIGILPTLCREDLTPEAMTDVQRYHVLAKTLNEIRGGDFEVHIRGTDEVKLSTSDVVFEGANTSFQIHLRVEPQRYADTFNTLQLVTPLVLAISANSPILLQNILWDETRIALFKQSVDYRLNENGRWNEPARVAFGHGWMREGPWESFAETVALHRPIMPINSELSPKQRFKQSPTPELPELCLHMGSVWPWNRAVYDPNGGGHLRVEMRALPSGPTAIDMAANTAFYVGLAFGLRDYINEWIPSMPFKYSEFNFYRAAQSGLDANLVWPHRQKHKLVETSIVSILQTLLPYARKGLEFLNISQNEINTYLSIIEQRIELKRSPSRWQRTTLKHFESTMDRKQACETMLNLYFENQQSGNPVHLWKWFN